MASLNENLTVEQVTNLVFQCAKKAAQKVMEEKSERLQGISEGKKLALKEL